MNTTSSEEISAPEEEVSLWEDFIDIFYAPRQVFARRPEGKWVLLLIIITIVMALLFYLSQGVLRPIFDAEVTRAMSRNPNVTPEQMAGAKKMSGIFGLLGLVVGFPIGMIIVGLVLWGVGKLVESQATLAVALSIVVYSQIPRILQSVLGLVQGLLMDASSLRSLYSVSFSPARFLDPDTTSAVLMTLAGRFDLFILWSAVLMAIGLQVLGKVGRVQSYVAAAIVWVVGVIPTLAGALSQGG